MTFAWEDGKIQAELKGQVPIHNIGARYYPQSISQCGIISLTEGEHTFSLHADYIAPPSPEAVADAGLGLMWVRLIPC